MKFLPPIAILIAIALFELMLPQRTRHLKVDSKTILINQLGYRPADKKIAFVKNENPIDFKITKEETGETVYQGNALISGDVDDATGDKVFYLNFSDLTKPGNYLISIATAPDEKKAFRIGYDVYNECALATLESFYYQRCGIAIDNGTVWKHPACHTKPAVFINSMSSNSEENNTKDETGGWHDAGDYNKFIPTTAVSAAFLLFAYESDTDFFTKTHSNIPENKNSLPDILDEARWGLDWIMKMQRGDGAIYHKVSIKYWTAEHLPQDETDTQYIFDISSSATAGAAAVMALGAGIFNKFDKKYAAQLLHCSISAWNFLKSHPNNIPEGGFVNPPGVEGGDYNDPDDLDERIWAAIELYRVTGSKDFLDYFLLNYKKVGGPNYTVGYDKTANFAYYSFLKIPNASSNEAAKQEIMTNLTNYADNLIQQIASSKYRCVLTPDQFYWGSNSVSMGFAFDLINAYNFTSKQLYLEGALNQLNYILGRNAFDISFVTGVGSNPVLYPYHQFSMLLNEDRPVPGLLVGGPNKYSNLNGKIISNYPGLCYEDNEKNYFVNEPAINYTAPLVYVAGYFSQADFNNKNDGSVNK